MLYNYGLKFPDLWVIFELLCLVAFIERLMFFLVVGDTQTRQVFRPTMTRNGVGFDGVERSYKSTC